MEQLLLSMLFLNTATIISHSRPENEKNDKTTRCCKRRETHTHKSRLSPQTMQRCANKLAKRGKEDRGGEKENAQKSERKCNFSIQYREIYISSPFFLFVRHKKNDVRQLPLNQKNESTASIKKN